MLLWYDIVSCALYNIKADITPSCNFHQTLDERVIEILHKRHFITLENLIRCILAPKATFQAKNELKIDLFPEYRRDKLSITFGF